MVVAVKVLRASMAELSELTAEFDHEVEFMSKIRHANLITFFGAGRTAAGAPFLVLEWAPRGSLRAVLADSTIPLPAAMQDKFALDTCRGMAFLHSKARAHRDLKVCPPTYVEV